MFRLIKRVTRLALGFQASQFNPPDLAGNCLGQLCKFQPPEALVGRQSFTCKTEN